jgi:hypothetical protein
MADTPVDAATLYDEKQDSRPGSSGIDVVRAENEFHALSRSLSKQSEAHRRRLSSTTVASHDVEKANKDEAEQFDLREYLSSSNDANQQAGIKHKVSTHVTVIMFLFSS